MFSKYFLNISVLCIIAIAPHSIPPSVLGNSLHSHAGAFKTPRNFVSKDLNTPREVEDMSVTLDVNSWAKEAQITLKAQLTQIHERIESEAKNVILFIGDGMSVTTLTAARIYKGQKEGSHFGGEETFLHFETFPNTALSKTYCVNRQTGDSACTATAYLAGIKNNMGTIGVTSDVNEGDCNAQMNTTNHVSSILAWAQAAGKSTGIVTTTSLMDASPAGCFAHIADRRWDNDADVREAGFDPTECEDIAKQMILREPGKNINVILGGGRTSFVNSTIPDVETGEGGKRADGRNLIQDWIDEKMNMEAKYVHSRSELLDADTTKVDYLLGIFSPSDLAYHSDPGPRDQDPTLSEMTRVAIQILSRNPNGFFLFVEGGLIDNAHHLNYAHKALVETVELDAAVELADLMTNDDETLLVVTADHSHVMTMNGYSRRGDPILGIADNDEYAEGRAVYTTLSYTNGPGQTPKDENCLDKNITGDDFLGLDYQQQAMIALEWETHGGEDVIIFAKGPFAHLYFGVLEQNVIPHIMAYASCIGSGEKFCKDDSDENSSSRLKMLDFKYLFFIFVLFTYSLM